MEDYERIKWIVRCFNAERNIEFKHNDTSEGWNENYGLKDFLKKLEAERNAAMLENFLINGSKEIFLEVIHMACSYHYRENGNSGPGLNIDMMYRLCYDTRNGFIIKRSHNVLNFTKQLKKRVEDYINWG